MRRYRHGSVLASVRFPLSGRQGFRGRLKGSPWATTVPWSQSGHQRLRRLGDVSRGHRLRSTHGSRVRGWWRWPLRARPECRRSPVCPKRTGTGVGATRSGRCGGDRACPAGAAGSSRAPGRRNEAFGHRHGAHATSHRPPSEGHLFRAHAQFLRQQPAPLRSPWRRVPGDGREPCALPRDTGSRCAPRGWRCRPGPVDGYQRGLVAPRRPRRA